MGCFGYIIVNTLHKDDNKDDDDDDDDNNNSAMSFESFFLANNECEVLV